MKCLPRAVAIGVDEGFSGRREAVAEGGKGRRDGFSELDSEGTITAPSKQDMRQDVAFPMLCT